MLVIGVILTLGVPNMQQFTANSRITGTANDLHSSFQLARSEAARSRTNITICASDNSGDPAPTCTGTFDDGWIVFADVNGDIVRDAAEVVLRRYPPIDTNIDITTNAGATYFGFAPTGLGRGDVAGAGTAMTAARICDDRGNVTAAGGWSAARVLIVTPIGRASVIRDKTQITAQGDCP